MSEKKPNPNPRRTRRTYPTELKLEAVQMFLDGHSAASIAELVCSRARAGRLMQEQGLEAFQPKSFHPRTTSSRHQLGYNENLLEDRPLPERPNEVWVGDIT